jgi:3-oxoacyl-[acyl-carrier-protein] synthase II
VWRGLVEGRSGIGTLTLFDPAGYRSRLAAQVADYQPATQFSPLEQRRLSRSDQIAVLAATEALEDAGMSAGLLDPRRIGIALGAGTSDLLRNEQYLADLRSSGVRRARPSRIFNFFWSTPVDVVAARFDIAGPRQCIMAACSSSTIAIGHAAYLVRNGTVDAMLAGGADVLCQLTFSGFNALRLVDTEPCRPFDRHRAGMTIGEASAMLVVEDLEHARQRGARVYAELAGYGVTCEAHHPTSPEPDGHALARTIRAALGAAAVSPDEIDHINAHGTGTVQNDRAEARAFQRVFGPRAGSIPVNSIKSMVGHCLGAAGAIEAAALALTIARGVIPPTIGHNETDPDCPLDVVPNAARDTRVSCGLSTSLAFGGNDSALVLRAV